MPRSLQYAPAATPFSAQPAPQASRLPVLLLRRGPVSLTELAELHSDQRLELFVADQLTPDWVSLAQRVAGTIVATQGDPMEALVYAVSGGIKGPIVLVFGRKFKIDCKALLAAGATDCLVTPVTASDLDPVVARLATNASLSRVDGMLGLLLDSIMLTVRLHDRCVRLTQREFAVLQCLSSYQGRPVAAHKLVTYVWGERSAVDQSRNLLDVYIFQLRKKLERLGLKGAISTVRGLGYALVPVAVQTLSPASPES